MTIRELYEELGFTEREIGHVNHQINNHNLKCPDQQIAPLDLNDDLDAVYTSHLAVFGKAIARMNGDLYLNNDEHYSLEHNENAAQYGLEHLDKYFRRS